MTEQSDLFRRALAGFGARVHAVKADQWTNATPCSDWDVRALVNHVAVEQLWVPPLVEGAKVADIGSRFDGDQLGSDPVATWDEAAAASDAAFGGPGALDGVVNLSSGDRPTSGYCSEMTADLVIHAWDLARATGGDEKLDPELVQLVWDGMQPYAADLAKSGYFAEAVPVPDDADLQTKLLALTGRQP